MCEVKTEKVDKQKYERNANTSAGEQQEKCLAEKNAFKRPRAENRRDKANDHKAERLQSSSDAC